MKIIPILTLGAAILPTPSLLAESGTVPRHVSNAATHSGQAAGHALGASGELGTSIFKTGVGAAALASTAAGGVVAGSGAATAAASKGVEQAGERAIDGAGRLWDFASGAPSARPTSDRTRSLPPPARSSVRRDPPPAAMIPAGTR